jgi:hypothetical protein
MFEQLLAFKTNFNKSELFCYGEAKNQEDESAYLFCCKTVATPFKYFGIFMYHKKLSNSDWFIMKERFQKKLCS